MERGSCLFLLIAIISISSVVEVDGNVNAKESVPVLMWSPEKSMSEQEPSFDRTFGAEEFHDSYLRSLVKSAPAATVVFLQDKLHTDDFTHYADVYSIDGEGGAFANIKTLMEENFSLEVPQVTSPSDSIKKLQDGYTGHVHSVSSMEDLQKLDLYPSSFLLIVHLPATADRVDREQALKHNDAMIGEVCKHLGKRGIAYSAVFTGKAASSDGQMPEEEVHSSRHLLDVPEVPLNATGVLMNMSDGNAFLFLRDIYICVKNKDDKVTPGSCVSNFTLIPTSNSADNSVFTNTTATIDLDFSNTVTEQGTFNIKIITDVVNQGDRWVIERMGLYVSPEDTKANNDSNIENGTLSKGEMDFVVPILYSFHCTEMRMNLYYLAEGFKQFEGTYVVFRGFQFQPFNVQKNQFFQSVDCVGFFTAAIWMGLVPAILLLAILTYGTLMLLNLSIMDRYDDPKGKTISVHASSD